MLLTKVLAGIMPWLLVYHHSGMHNANDGKITEGISADARRKTQSQLIECTMPGSGRRERRSCLRSGARG